MHMAGHLDKGGGPSIGEAVELIKLTISVANLEDLIESIAGDFERSDGRRAASISPGLSPSSFFYPANGEFHLLYTCNTWSADKLEAGGFGISSFGIVTAADLVTALHSKMAVE